ncbi:MAG: branched-chain amino acid ABC transporter permease [Pseudomonadota bacterium]
MMDPGIVLIDLLNGLTRGMLYFLMASGLTLAFSVLGIINFAHGSLIMLGAYFAWTLLQAIGGGWFFFAIIILSGIIVGVVGILIEIFFLRRIYGSEHLYQLLLTFALIMIIDGLVLEIWGGMPRCMILPGSLLGAVSIGGNFFPKYSLFILLCSTAVAILGWFFLYKTKFGKASRAAAADVEITSALGINVPFVYCGMFAIGAALAGFSGGLGLAMSSITPGVGAHIAVTCFAVIVIGGLGSLVGTLVAALILGIFEAFGDHYFPQLAMALPFIIMAVILLARPQGLFGRKG